MGDAADPPAMLEQIVAPLGRRLLASHRAFGGAAGQRLGAVVAERRRPKQLEAIRRLIAQRNPACANAQPARIEDAPVSRPPGMSEFAARWLFSDDPPEGIPFGDALALTRLPRGGEPAQPPRPPAGPQPVAAPRRRQGAPLPRGIIEEGRGLRLSSMPPLPDPDDGARPAELADRLAHRGERTEDAPGPARGDTRATTERSLQMPPRAVPSDSPRAEATRRDGDSDASPAPTPAPVPVPVPVRMVWRSAPERRPAVRPRRVVSQPDRTGAESDAATDVQRAPSSSRWRRLLDRVRVAAPAPVARGDDEPVAAAPAPVARGDDEPVAAAPAPVARGDDEPVAAAARAPQGDPVRDRPIVLSRSRSTLPGATSTSGPPLPATAVDDHVQTSRDGLARRQPRPPARPSRRVVPAPPPPRLQLRPRGQARRRDATTGPPTPPHTFATAAPRVARAAGAVLQRENDERTTVIFPPPVAWAAEAVFAGQASGPPRAAAVPTAPSSIAPSARSTTAAAGPRAPEPEPEPALAAAGVAGTGLDDVYDELLQRLRRDLIVERERMGDIVGKLP
jgi:hypothetical protein